ncbi:Nucleotidyltransferase [Candidatus Syntrophocurvum alkaliphilum]|uniref:Nucleotidyltransferase n=1 Tax=Candidatus Syntrophocurvum alkaliphilum TaxID=2293317 RepID=A0A6I6DMG6_9FIRM|nr:HepT-like ribonuclease domain-containing protein [Candidatus Syntrophocurvum alkaliphilum]QGU00897.1 Nucleotidyltransferase [Candidatus Syntrophocurvum alkaliphilum]
MSSKNKQIIKKMIQEANVIEELIEGYNLEKFIADERTKRAACMTLINIGELSKNLSEDFKKDYNFVAWRAIAGMRDVTAHKYQTLKMGDVWVTLITDIPKLKEQLNIIYIEIDS